MVSTVAYGSSATTAKCRYWGKNNHNVQLRALGICDINGYTVQIVPNNQRDKVYVNTVIAIPGNQPGNGPTFNALIAELTSLTYKPEESNSEHPFTGVAFTLSNQPSDASSDSSVGDTNDIANDIVQLDGALFTTEAVVEKANDAYIYQKDLGHSSLLSRILNFFKTKLEPVFHWIEELWESLVSAFNSLVNFVKNAYKSFISAFDSLVLYIEKHCKSLVSVQVMDLLLLLHVRFANRPYMS